MGEKKTFHPKWVCHSWQYLRGRTTAHLFAVTQDNKGTQNCPKHSHKQNHDTLTEVEGHQAEMDSLDEY